DARRSLHALQLEADSCLLQLGQCELCVLVVADAGDQLHLRAEACGRERLVRALAAGDAAEGRSGDRFARAWKALRAGDEVEVDRPDDGQAYVCHLRNLSDRKHAQILERPPEEVLPQVEEPG